MWMSDLGHIDTVSRTGGRCGWQTSSTAGGAMSELHDFNQRVIREFRANQGKVSGQLANMPVLLLTMTGARSGRTLTTPLVYTTDGDRLVVIASFAGAPKHPACGLGHMTVDTCGKQFLLTFLACNFAGIVAVMFAL